VLSERNVLFIRTLAFSLVLLPYPLDSKKGGIMNLWKLVIVALSVLTGMSAWADKTYEPGDFLIKFKPGVVNFSQNMTGLIESDSAVESIGNNWIHIKVAPAQLADFASNQDLLKSIRKNPDVEYAQPNYFINLIEDYTSKDPTLLDAARAQFGNSKGPLWGGSKSKPEIPAATITPMFGPDPLADQQWAMTAIHAVEAWKVNKGDRHMVVAVIDTGVDYTHEDLAANIWHNPNEIAGNGKDDDGNGYTDDIIGWDFVDNDNKPYDVATGILGTLLGGNPGHGTHCSGTIAAVSDNSVGISGVAPNVKIMPLRFLNERGQGDTAHAVKAINYAVAAGAKVLSNSWGSAGEEEGSGALKDAIKNAMDHDVLFIAAAGNGRSGVGYNNDTDKSPSFPATYNYENIISVAAIDKQGELGKFSNFGPKTVHIAAPGVDVLSTTVGNKYSDAVIKVGSFKLTWDGTSMAAPFVAGAAALVWSQHPEYKFSDVRRKLLETAEKLPSLKGKITSEGKINLAEAIK
jgi:thermitase